MNNRAKRVGAGVITALAVAILGDSGAVAAAESPAYDLIIRNGTVFDGSGRPGRVADVAITGDRIMAVGKLRRARGRIEREARGRFVAPGFVSVHDHSAPENYARPNSLLTQGITSAIANPDGGGPLDLRAQLAVPMGLNYGAYVGFNSVWRDVVGLANRHATEAEVVRMRRLVVDGLEAGAFGISAGLDYKPGYYATENEVVAVVSAAKAWRTNFPNHERVYPGNGYSSMGGMRETVRIGERAGVMPVITHMKLQGGDQGKVSQALALATDGARRGVPVGMDAYAYTFGSTSLEQLTIPAWAQEGGTDAMLARFKDPALRQRIVTETDDQLNRRWGGPAGVYLSEMRRELTDVIREKGGIDPGEAIVRLLEQGQRRVLLRFGTEDDQAAIVTSPLVAVSCDCGATPSMTGHPRNWGAFPRVLGRYVREQKLMTWGEAIRKMTALPAAMIGLSERGYLLPGMIADITIFNPATVIDRSTIDRPTEPSVGIEMVTINGKLALDGGRPTGEAVGRALVRSRHEPARAMDRGDRRLRVDGLVAATGVRVAVRLHQAARAARPVGTIRVTGLVGGPLVVTPTLLQTTPGWASATGIGRWSNGKRQAVTLLAEKADPLAAGRPSVTVLVDGQQAIAGELADSAISIDRHLP